MQGKSRILAVILAGGLARRMVGKPLFTLGGRRLVDLVIESARAQGLDVAVNLHALTPEATAPFGDLPCIADAIPGHAGPLAGVLAAMDFAAREKCDAVLSLPCDTPFLPDDLAERLCEAAGKTRDGLACAASGGRVHPVVALWPVVLRENLRLALGEGERAVGKFQRRFDCAAVEWSTAPRDPFFNVNTPADFAQAEALLAARVLDLRGLKCPLPVLRTRKCLGGMAPGERVEVLCTDPMSFVDVPHLLRETGDFLETQSRADGEAVFVIRKAAR